MKKILVLTMAVIVMLVGLVGCGLGESLTEGIKEYKTQKTIEVKIDKIDETVDDWGMDEGLKEIVKDELKASVEEDPSINYASFPVEYNGDTYRVNYEF